MFFCILIESEITETHRITKHGIVLYRILIIICNLVILYALLNSFHFVYKKYSRPLRQYTRDVRLHSLNIFSPLFSPAMTFFYMWESVLYTS